MQEHLEEFQKLKVKVISISFSDPKIVQEHQKQAQWKIDLYSDPERKAYRLFGLKRASFGTVFHPLTIFKYAQLVLKGRKIQQSNQDIYQLGGDFLINKIGEIVYSFRSTRPDDRPSVKILLDFAKRLLYTTG